MSDEIFSKHIFLYPFRWDYKTASDLVDAFDFQQRLNISKFQDFVTGKNWIKSNYPAVDPLEYYNDATYFYEYVRPAVYSNTKDKSVVKNYEYDLKETKTSYEIAIEKEKITSIYRLGVKKIALNIYETGIGILSFHLDNNHYHDKSDILKINDFGRRIYPQFLDTSSRDASTQAGLIAATKNAFLAKEIKIINERGDEIFKEDFSNFFQYDEVVKK